MTVELGRPVATTRLDREPGRTDTDLASVGLAGRHLVFETGGQELLMGPAGLGPARQAVDRLGIRPR
jgi:hypothetical protein